MSTTPTPAPGQGPGAASGLPAGPSTKPNNTIWWVLGFFGAALLVVIVGGIFMAGYFLRQVRVEQHGQQVEITTPGGKVTLQADNSIKDPGLPIYPGAEMDHSGGSVELTRPNDERLGVSGVTYYSNDPVEKVDGWYRERLGGEFERHGSGESWRDSKGRDFNVERGDVAYVSEQDDLVRVLAIKKRVGGTEIDMARFGKQQTQ